MAEQTGGGSGAKVSGGSGGYLNSGFQVQSSQLAIFYAGSIHVFDSITPEKAQAIMLIATAAAAAAQRATRSASAESATGADQARPPPQQGVAPGPGEAFCKLQGELPLARRNSLQRFLEKRRERCLSMAPYAVNKSPPTPPESCSGSESLAPLSSPSRSDDASTSN